MNAISSIQNFIFPQGIIYNRDKGRVQTFEVNSFFTVIPEIARLVAKMKNGNSLNLEQIAALVTPSRLASSSFQCFHFFLEEVSGQTSLNVGKQKKLSFQKAFGDA